ncbi:hypothetical protein HOLleu_01778 [Holothuria leucospilota]|uniref:Uncharacterized protein n=1 Tax=Holothuria leucospilota TaxID=206669 RepID=A0A9Q1CPG3_HOLLE|nr:hypothetical protein HOLleu_01778 [Holothuria leucospilota]
MPLKKPVFYLVICKQLSTSAVVLLRKFLSEDIDNKKNTDVRSEARGARKNFESFRRIFVKKTALI